MIESSTSTPILSRVISLMASCTFSVSAGAPVQVGKLTMIFSTSPLPVSAVLAAVLLSPESVLPESELPPLLPQAARENAMIDAMKIAATFFFILSSSLFYLFVLFLCFVLSLGRDSFDDLIISAFLPPKKNNSAMNLHFSAVSFCTLYSFLSLFRFFYTFRYQHPVSRRRFLWHNA